MWVAISSSVQAGLGVCTQEEAPSLWSLHMEMKVFVHRVSAQPQVEGAPKTSV
jgi:hypothetical protein